MKVRIVPQRTKRNNKTQYETTIKVINTFSVGTCNTSKGNIPRQLMCLSPRPLAALVERKGGMFLLVFKGMAIRKLERRYRKQDE